MGGTIEDQAPKSLYASVEALHLGAWRLIPCGKRAAAAGQAILRVAADSPDSLATDSRCQLRAAPPAASSSVMSLTVLSTSCGVRVDCAPLGRDRLDPEDSLPYARRHGRCSESGREGYGEPLPTPPVRSSEAGKCRMDEEP